MTAKVEKGIDTPWYLELQEALVSLGGVCHPIVRGKPRSGRSDKESSGELGRGAVGHTCTTADVKFNLDEFSLGGDDHTAVC